MATTISKTDLHRDLCLGLNKTFVKKNHDYGDSFAKARHVIPNYTLGKLYDKFQRFMTLTQTETAAVTEETIEDTLLDLADYCVMEVLERRLDAQERTQHEDSVQNIQQQDQQTPASVSSSSSSAFSSCRFTRANQ